MGALEEVFAEFAFPNFPSLAERSKQYLGRQAGNIQLPGHSSVHETDPMSRYYTSPTVVYPS